jgi:hypothetical protein
MLDPRGDAAEIVSKVSDGCGFHDTIYLSPNRGLSSILKWQDLSDRSVKVW